MPLLEPIKNTLCKMFRLKNTIPKDSYSFNNKPYNVSEGNNSQRLNKRKITQCQKVKSHFCE